MSVKKNNFRSTEVKEKSKYKLWILYKPEFVCKVKKNPFTYYSYNTKSDGGLASLINFAEKRKDKFLLAILYDNQSENNDRNELRRWTSGSPVKDQNFPATHVTIKRPRPRIYMPINKKTW